MKKRIGLAIAMIVMLLVATFASNFIVTNASVVNPDPEVITGTVEMPKTNYLNGGGFEYDWVWWTSGTQNKYNTEDKVEGKRSLEISPNGSWGGDAGLGSGDAPAFKNVPALQDGQMYKMTVCFKILNPTEVGSGLDDQLLVGIYGGSSAALQVRVCADLYGSYGSQWIKVVKYEPWYLNHRKVGFKWKILLRATVFLLRFQ